MRENPDYSKNKGKVVILTSQANGSTKTKEGVVLAFIPKWTKIHPSLLPEDAFMRDGKINYGRVQFNGFYHRLSDHYLVKVWDGKKNLYYLPKASTVKIKGKKKTKSKKTVIELTKNQSDTLILILNATNSTYNENDKAKKKTLKEILLRIKKSVR